MLVLAFSFEQDTSYMAATLCEGWSDHIGAASRACSIYNHVSLVQHVCGRNDRADLRSLQHLVSTAQTLKKTMINLLKLV